MPLKIIYNLWKKARQAIHPHQSKCLLLLIISLSNIPLNKVTNPRFGVICKKMPPEAASLFLCGCSLEWNVGEVRVRVEIWLIKVFLPCECLKHRSLHCKLMFWRKETSWTKTYYVVNVSCFYLRSQFEHFCWHFNSQVKSSLSFWHPLKLLTAIYTYACSCNWKLLKTLLQSYHHTHTHTLY